MGWLAWTLAILTVAIGIALTIIVMMQSSKEGTSAVTGGNTFYGSNKSKTMDGLLSKLTIGLGAIFAVLCFLTTIAIIK